MQKNNFRKYQLCTILSKHRIRFPLSFIEEENESYVLTELYKADIFGNDFFAQSPVFSDNRTYMTKSHIE